MRGFDNEIKSTYSTGGVGVMGSDDLIDDDGFWRLLLGKKYDRIPNEERDLRRLVEEFCVGRKRFIKKRYESEHDLYVRLQEVSNEKARDILLTIWAEKQWEQKSSGGDDFEVDVDFEEEILRLREDGVIVQELLDGMTLVWPSKEVRIPTPEDDEQVRSQLLEKASPLFLKEHEGTLEVRGSKRRIERFSDDLTASDNIEKVEREETDESIIDGLASAVEDELETLKLVGAEFRSTHLPDGSSIRVSNPEGVYRDLNSDELQQSVINLQSLSELNYLKFRHEKTGKTVTLNLNQTDSGFYFEIQDDHLPEPEKVNIKRLITNEIGVSFDKEYRYDVQHQEPYIFHQILRGKSETYRRYFDDLSDKNRELIREFTEITEISVFQCYRCYREYEDDQPDECPNCGYEEFQEQENLTIETDDNAIFERVHSLFDSLNPDARLEDGTRLIGMDFETFPTKHNQYLKTSLQRLSVVESSHSHTYEYYVYCLGNGRVPQRLKRYLLNAILVVYGRAAVNGREQFGTIDLHNLLYSDDPSELVASAIEESKSKLRNRVISEATKAKDRLTEVNQHFDSRNSNVAESEITIQFESSSIEEYGYDEFERDVFFIFKSLFLFTERWGRQGKTETDGCLVIPEEDDYYIAGYDPKLTSSKKGYDLDASEKNKVAYYMSVGNKGEFLKNALGKHTIDGHILISNNFREGQFQPLADRVNDWFNAMDNEELKEVPVVFLPLDKLLSLYRIFESHYDYIEGYSKVQKAFRTATIRELRREGQSGYCVIDDEACERIRERVIQAESNVSRNQNLRSHSE